MNKNKTNFKKEDVLIVAKALLEIHYYFDSGDYQKDQYICELCAGKSREMSIPDDIEKINHKLNCPILVARDLLT